MKDKKDQSDSVEKIWFITGVNYLIKKSPELSQEKIAQKCGVSGGYISAILHGQKFPNLMRCADIARACDTNLISLLTLGRRLMQSTNGKNIDQRKQVGIAADRPEHIVDNALAEMGIHANSRQRKLIADLFEMIIESATESKKS